MQFNFGNESAPKRGGGPGPQQGVCNIDPEDSIVRVKGFINSGFIKSLQLISQQGKSCMIGTGDPTSFDINPNGFRLSHFSGSVSDYNINKVVNHINLHWKPQNSGCFQTIITKKTFRFQNTSTSMTV